MVASGSQYALQDFPPNFFDKGGNVYEQLDPSKKMTLVNFLCDEALATRALRSWIHKQKVKYPERKEAKMKIAAENKEKCLKQKMQEKMPKLIHATDGAPLSITEYEKLVSEMKAEALSAHAEVLEAIDAISKSMFEDNLFP